MRMAEFDAETDFAPEPCETDHIRSQELEVMILRRALNDIIMLEYVHSGLPSARVIQEACDIARRAIYGKTRRAALGEGRE